LSIADNVALILLHVVSGAVCEALRVSFASVHFSIYNVLFRQLTYILGNDGCVTLEITWFQGGAGLNQFWRNMT
jgi:hypothetical protein